MKRISIILLLAVFLLGAFPLMVSAAEDSIDITLEEKQLGIKITGIDTEDKSEMISVSVLRSDALSKPQKEDILYANTIYTDGKDTAELKVQLKDIDIYEYHLVVSDKSGKIAYAQPLAIRTPLTIADVVLEEKVYDGTTDGIVKEVIFAEASGFVKDVDYTAEVVYESANPGEQNAVVTVQMLDTDKTNAYILENTIFETTGLITKLPEELKIITQPKDAAAVVGENAVVSFEAVGDGLKYTWYYKNPGNVKFYESGAEFAEESVYTIPMYKWRDGQQVYCVIEDAYGNSVQTNIVTISIDAGSIRIVKDITDVCVDLMGDEAQLTIEATGEGLTYEWYYKNPGNVKFYLSGDDFVSEDGASYTIPVAAWRDGQQVYCVITDANGISIQSNTVTLSVAK